MKPKFPQRTLDKAVEIVEAINNGVDLATLHAKRLKYDRNLISVKIGARIRVLYNSITKAHMILTHSEYNNVISGPKG